jgi:hypothetical protein
MHFHFASPILTAFVTVTGVLQWGDDWASSNCPRCRLSDLAASMRGCNWPPVIRTVLSARRTAAANWCRAVAFPIDMNATAIAVRITVVFGSGEMFQTFRFILGYEEEIESCEKKWDSYITSFHKLLPHESWSFWAS